MNRVALVTGAGRGIGLAIARRLAQEGVIVAVNDIDASLAGKAAEELKSSGLQAHALPGDVSDPAAVQEMVSTAVNHIGDIVILVNNAGICRRRKLEEISVDDWDRTLGVNLKGAFLCCREAAPLMKTAGWGRIVNIASVSGKIGGLMVGLDYTASKGGVLALTKGLARELAPYGITVNAVCPAMVDTEIGSMFSPDEKEKYLASVPLRRLATVEDVAGAVAYLVSDEACYITGEVLDVNGGLLMD